MKTTIETDSDFIAISAEEAKHWCRIDTTADDELIEGLIRAATEAAEAFTCRSIVPATVEFAFDTGFRIFDIPTAPLGAVTKVELEDQQGQRVEVDDFGVRKSDAAAQLTLVGQSRGCLTVVATCEVGYATPAAIPQAIKQAIAVHVGSAYAGREGQDTAQATFQNLLRPLQVGGF